MRADRLLAIMLLLQTQGKLTAQRLADELEVSRRTILRDLDALSAAGVPVLAEGGHGGGIVLDERYRATLAGLRDDEIRTLFVGDNTRLLSELGLGDAAHSTMLKLRAVLPAAHQPAVEHMRQRMLIDPAWWWRDAQPLSSWEELQRAVFEDRRIQAVYERPSGELLERTLEPYSFVAKSSSWYLVAAHGGELRTYRVSRFREIALLDEHFRRREGFDLRAYWDQQLQQYEELTSEYRFTMRLHADGMDFLKKIVPAPQYQIEPAGDGAWATVQVQLDSMDLARMLALGLGAQAVVVEPQELCEAVLATAGAILRGANEAGS
jgi:predicted DNA-binding transcriptional regulator YafY